MDIEELSKAQIVLLTLLVSFVTSIATGIVTVSLMNQAPPVVAQTVNRVIEHTVEKVVPSGAAAAAVTREKTVVVKETDLIAQAVARVSPSLVRLYANDEQGPTFLGIGLVLDEGSLVTDAAALGDAKEATAVFSDGAKVRTTLSKRDEKKGLAYLDAATSTSDEKVPAWTPTVIATDQPLLGETVVALSGSATPRIDDGIISALASLLKDATSSTPALIETNVSASSIVPGTPIINTDGAVVGLSTGVSRTDAPGTFINASMLGALKSPAKGDDAASAEK